MTLGRARFLWLAGPFFRCALTQPYSPDFNPIEKPFSKLKALLRKAAERGVDAFWNRNGALTSQFSATECANFFQAAGYEPV